jgi:hypothetical protein
LTEHDKSVLGWGTTVVNIATAGDFIHNNFQLMRPMLAGLADSVYTRFNPPELGDEPMDASSEETLSKIKQLARAYMDSPSAARQIWPIKRVLREAKRHEVAKSDNPFHMVVHPVTNVGYLGPADF